MTTNWLCRCAAMSKVCGTGSGNFPQPGDPDLSNSLLSAVPAFGGIDVLWTYPLLNPQAIAHTLLYRSTNENPATKVNHRTVTGDFYYDKSTTDAAITYYYWVQHVSVNGTVGDMIGPAFAMARPTIEQVMQGLTGRIDDSLLGQALKAEIASIKTNRQDLLAETVNRVAANGDLLLEYSDLEINLANVDTLVRQEITQRTEADSTIVNQVNVLFAQLEDSNALILQEQTVRASDDEALASRIDTTQAQTEDNIAAITAETTARATADEALATTVQSLVASTSQIFRSPTAPDPGQVTINENDLWVDTDNDNRMYQWDGSTWLDAQDGGIAGAFAAIQVEQEARVNSDGALASTITTLEASAASDTNTAKQAAIDAAAVYARAQKKLAETTAAAYADGIVSDEEARAIADATAKANVAQAVSSALANAAQNTANNAVGAAVTADNKADAAAALAVAKANEAETAANTYTDGKATAAQTASLNAAKAYTNQRELIVKSYADGIVTTAEQAAIAAAAVYTRAQKAAAGVIAAAYADGIVTAEETRAIADATAKANAAEQRASALANAAQGSANQANSAIQTEQTARASGDSALANSLNTLESTLGGEIAQVETNAQTNIDTLNGEVTNIGALYTTKLNVNGLIGGFGIYNDGSEVLAGFDVDTFFVGRTQANKVKPFIIKDGETFIDEAVIQSLTFNKMRSEDGSLAFTPTVYDGLGNVTETGKLKVDYLDVDNLVVNSAQSVNYTPGSPGWKLSADGSVDINGHVNMTSGSIASSVTIGGLGSFAYKSSLFYNEVSGTKPPTNADNTGSNTAFDTERVAGNSAQAIASELIRTRDKADLWTRPGQTLIDGNKIFTGDAYVDTLQINGEAVTLPAGARRSSEINVFGWTTVTSFTYNHGESNSIGGILVGYVDIRSNTNTTYYCRILVNGSVVESAQISGLTRVSISLSSYQNLPTGSYTIAIQANYTASGDFPFAAARGSIGVIGGKR